MEANMRQKGPFSTFCNLLMINLNSNTISYPSTSGVSSNICWARCITVFGFSVAVGSSSSFPSNKAQGTAMTITSTTTTATPIKISFRFI